MSDPIIDRTMAVRIDIQLGWEPKRKWVGLTRDEIDDIGHLDVVEDWFDFYAAVEAKLKEKNGG